jgi:ribonuclease-3
MLDGSHPDMDRHAGCHQGPLMDPDPLLASDDAQRFARCQQIVQHTFRDPSLLRAALTHASGAQHRLASNERLEFLGDAILGVIVCEYLFEHYPQMLEGQLTKIKSVIVSRQMCARLSRSLGLESVLIVGKGISSDKPVPPSLLADVFESLVAAVYLDGGMDAARRFVLRSTIPEIQLTASGQADDNFKSILQQVVQRDFNETPFYRLLEEKGPDHDKTFRVAVHFGGREFTPAWGRNKKEAEQRAAGNALAELSGDGPPFGEI